MLPPPLKEIERLEKKLRLAATLVTDWDKLAKHLECYYDMGRLLNPELELGRGRGYEEAARQLKQILE
jgi:hypothetical protein